MNRHSRLLAVSFLLALGVGSLRSASAQDQSATPSTPAANAPAAAEPTAATAPSSPDTSAPGKPQKKAPNSKKELKKMSTELSLTDDQRRKVKAILEDRDQKLSAVDTSDKKGKKQMRAIRNSSETQIAALLTDDQKKQLEAAKGQRKAKGASTATQ